MRWPVIPCAAVLLVGAAAPAAAQDAENSADIRCALAAMAMVGATQDATMKQQATMAALYYVGRLDGRNPNLDLEARLRQEMAKMAPQELAGEAQRCGQQLMVRGKALQAIGEHFKTEAKPPAENRP
jgi:hypothetical protein